MNDPETGAIVDVDVERATTGAVLVTLYRETEGNHITTSLIALDPELADDLGTALLAAALMPGAAKRGGS